MKWSDVTAEGLRVNRPDILVAVEKSVVDALVVEGAKGDLLESHRSPDPVEPGPDAAQVAALKAATDAQHVAETERDTLKSGALMESALREAALPVPLADLVRKDLTGRVVTEDEIKARIGEVKTAGDALLESHRPMGIPGRGAGGSGAPAAGANTLAGLLMPPKAGG